MRLLLEASIILKEFLTLLGSRIFSLETSHHILKNWPLPITDNGCGVN